MHRCPDPSLPSRSDQTHIVRDEGNEVMAKLLYRLGRFSADRPGIVIGAWLLLAAAVIVASTMVGKEMEESFEVPGLDSQVAVDLLSEAGATQAGLTARVVATPNDPAATFDSVAAQAALADVRAAVAGLPDVISTTDTVSPDGRVALLWLQYPILEELSADNLAELEAAVDGVREGSPLRIEFGGDISQAFAESETGTGEMIGIIAAVVILLVAFGSVVAMGLPIGMAIAGLALGVSTMPLLTYLIDIPSWAPQMGSMIGLGVGIDYALFLVTRHREFLERGLPVAEAAGRAVATAGQAVVFAGGTVVIAILGLSVAGLPFMTAAGVATSVIVLIMVLASITFMPAMLGVAGPWINRLGVGRRRPIPLVDGVSVRWSRWGRHVSSHAWPYAIGVTALLLAMTAPVFALQLGFPDEGTLPDSRTERQAYDLVAEGFGAGSNGPLVIAVDLNGNTSLDNTALVEPLADAVAADPGVWSVAPPEINADAGIATLLAFPTTSPQDQATLDTVARLRGEVFPSVLAGTEASAHIGGSTANWGDLGERVAERMPWFIAAVVVLSFLLLMLVFRSILVPLKAAMLNLLSIGAAYGVLVMVFQWGWGKELIGLESTVPIVSFIPMFMFAVLFGLSMDYEVFLLSRVREEYLATGDNEASVIRGLAGTARVITSAALIMIAVFGGFVTGDDPAIKMLGLGLAVAIFVDATIVRVILVPAMMKLMGDANWWLPGWLDRGMPTVDIDGGVDLERSDADDLVRVA